MATDGDIAATAREWQMSEGAAIPYDEQREELYDAHFLLHEEWGCFSEPEEQTA